MLESQKEYKYQELKTVFVAAINQSLLTSWFNHNVLSDTTNMSLQISPGHQYCQVWLIYFVVLMFFMAFFHRFHLNHQKKGLRKKLDNIKPATDRHAKNGFLESKEH